MSETPQAVLLLVGNELVSGASADSNGRLAAQMLSAAGFLVRGMQLVRDDPNDLSRAIKKALIDVELVVISGGLGPTEDDITRDAVALSVGRILEFKPELFEEVQACFSARGREMPESNRRQAYLPEGASALSNAMGSAPGILLCRGNRTITALPGVPFEFCHMLEEQVVPTLLELYGEALQPRVARSFLVTGRSESAVGEQVAPWMTASSGPELGITATFGGLSLRAVAAASDAAGAAKQLDTLEKTLREALGDDLCEGYPGTPEDAVAAYPELRSVAVVDGIGGGRLAARLQEAGVEVLAWSGPRSFLAGCFPAFSPEFDAIEAAVGAATAAGTSAGVAILEGEEGFYFIGAVLGDEAHEAVVVPAENPEVNRWLSEARALDLLRRLGQGVAPVAASEELEALAVLGDEVSRVEESTEEDALAALDLLAP